MWPLIWVSAPFSIISQRASQSILGYHEGESDFYDGSYALYTLYNEKTDELDKPLIEGWLEHSRDLMVLVS